jgi:transposase-like protein
MYRYAMSVTDRSVPWLISTLITNHHHAVSLLMPRKKNPFPIRKQYSRDLKKRVVYQAFMLEKTTTEISTDLDIPLRVVQRVLKCWREIGEVCKDRTRMGRAPLMKPDEVKVSQEFMLETV